MGRSRKFCEGDQWYLVLNVFHWGPYVPSSRSIRVGTGISKETYSHLWFSSGGGWGGGGGSGVISTLCDNKLLSKERKKINNLLCLLSGIFWKSWRAIMTVQMKRPWTTSWSRYWGMLQKYFCMSEEESWYQIQSKFSVLTFCILASTKWVIWQTVQTQMKCSIMLHFIRVCTVC